MLKKLSFASLTLLLASGAFAQTATITPSSPVSTTVGGSCTTVISSVTYNASDNSFSINASSCGTTTPTPSFALSISATTYTIGSGAAAPVITWTPNAQASGATCTLTPPAGITGSISGNTFITNTPTTAGTYTFAPTCTLNSTAVAVSPASVSLTVSTSGGGGGGTGSCGTGAQPSSSINGKVLQRQCSGDVFIQPGPIAGSQGLAQTDLGKVLGGTSFGSYSYAGYSPTFSIQSGYYIALQFTPTVSGSFQMTANPSYGDGGTITVSTVPGAMTQGSTGFVCGVGRSAANGIYVSTAGGVCGVTVGTTYYLNIADVDPTGNNLCYNGRPNSCTFSTVSYTIYQ